MWNWDTLLHSLLLFANSRPSAWGSILCHLLPQCPYEPYPSWAGLMPPNASPCGMELFPGGLDHPAAFTNQDPAGGLYPTPLPLGPLSMTPKIPAQIPQARLRVGRNAGAWQGHKTAANCEVCSSPELSPHPESVHYPVGFAQSVKCQHSVMWLMEKNQLIQSLAALKTSEAWILDGKSSLSPARLDYMWGWGPSRPWQALSHLDLTLPSCSGLLWPDTKGPSQHLPKVTF